MSYFVDTIVPPQEASFVNINGEISIAQIALCMEVIWAYFGIGKRFPAELTAHAPFEKPKHHGVLGLRVVYKTVETADLGESLSSVLLVCEQSLAPQ